MTLGISSDLAHVATATSATIIVAVDPVVIVLPVNAYDFSYSSNVITSMIIGSRIMAVSGAFSSSERFSVFYVACLAALTATVY